ncbi:uncharacterized protein A4U43_C08F30020 [Asparagus officinalis]|nr:uncharacterized protein A4U43_C08F30020 [Asparagus officinalis]
MITSKKLLGIAKKKIQLVSQYSRASAAPAHALCFLRSRLVRSLSFVYVLRTLPPVLFCSIGILFEKETFRSSATAYMVSVAVQLACIVFRVVRLVLLKIVGFSFHLVNSALSTGVGGFVRDLLLIALSWWVITDATTMMMMVNLIGYGIEFSRGGLPQLKDN